MWREGRYSRFLRCEGITLKQMTLVAREQDRPDVSRRLQWRKYQGRIDPGRLIFIRVVTRTYST
jgi:hypothetical protein